MATTPKTTPSKRSVRAFLNGIDTDVLEQIIERSVRDMTRKYD